MRKLLVAAMAALLIPMAASAQISVGASLGFSKAMGDAVKDGPMSDGITGGLPIEINAKYEVMPNLGVGVYAGWMKGFIASDLSDACDASGVDCSASGIRLGVTGEYGFGDMGGFIPYGALRIGWAKDSMKQELSGDWIKQGFSGWEVGLQGGADMKLGEKLKAGLFIGLSFSQYGTASIKCSSDSICTDDSADITDKAMHEWLTIGVRGQFGL